MLFDSSTLGLYALNVLEPEEAVVQLPEFGDLLALWLERRGDAKVPDWGSIDFPDFVGWHSSIVVSAFEGDEPNPRIKISGEFYTEMVGANRTGKRFSETHGELYERQLKDHFRDIRDQKLIGLAEGRLSLPGREHVRFKVVELPFTEGGSRVERLVHAVTRLNAPRDA